MTISDIILALRWTITLRSLTISWLGLAALMLASGLLGAAVTWHVTGDRGVSKVVRGTITGTNLDVSVVGFRPDGGPRVYEGPPGSLNGGKIMPVSASANWTDVNGTEHSGSPIACIPSGTQGRRVDVEIVEYGPARAPELPFAIIVSVRCLDRGTTRLTGRVGWAGPGPRL